MRNRIPEMRGDEVTQADLAKAIKVSRQTVNAIETRRHLPNLDIAFRIAEFFGKPLEEIFYRDDTDNAR